MLLLSLCLLISVNSMGVDRDLVRSTAAIEKKPFRPFSLQSRRSAGFWCLVHPVCVFSDLDKKNKGVAELHSESYAIAFAASVVGPQYPQYPRDMTNQNTHES
jgi:hypothetical protein